MKRDPRLHTQVHDAPPLRRARLQALVFHGAALGAALVMAMSESKLPPYHGE